MSVIEDLSGTSEGSFGLGVGGARIRSNAGTIEARNAANTALAPFKAATVSARSADGNATVDLATTTNNAGIEIAGNTGLAYIDFSRTLAADFDARLILNSATEFQFNGASGLKYVFTRPLEAQSTFGIKNGSFNAFITTGVQAADRIFSLPVVANNREIVVRNAIAQPTPTEGNVLVYDASTTGPWTSKPIQADGVGIVVTQNSSGINIATSTRITQIESAFALAPEGAVPTKSAGNLIYAVPSGGGSSSTPLISVTASKTFALSDANSRQNCTGTGLITLTLPSNAAVAFSTGTTIICQLISGRHRLVLSSGVTLDNMTSLNLEYLPAGSTIELLKTGTDAWQIRLRHIDPDLCIYGSTHWMSLSEPTFGFQTSGTQSGVVIISNPFLSNASFPGEVRLNTGTAVSGRCYVGTSVGQLPVSRCWYTEHLCSIGQLGNTTDNYTFRVGFMDDFQGLTVGGAVWRYNHAENGGQFEAICRTSAGVSTIVPSSTTVAVNTFYRLGVLMDLDGGRVLFFIDGTLFTTISTNLPNMGTGAGINIAKTAGSSTLFVYLNQSIFYGQTVA